MTKKIISPRRESFSWLIILVVVHLSSLYDDGRVSTTEKKACRMISKHSILQIGDMKHVLKCLCSFLDAIAIIVQYVASNLWLLYHQTRRRWTPKNPRPFQINNYKHDQSPPKSSRTDYPECDIYIYRERESGRGRGRERCFWHHILAISPDVCRNGSHMFIEIYRVGDNRRTINTLTTPHICDQLGTENACKTLFC